VLAIILAIGAAVLAHIAPFPFLLDRTDQTIWKMPPTKAPTVYLTFDDGPNPSATPELLDVLARHGVTATFFVIDRHLTPETAPIVRRAFEEGHAVALHWHSAELMFRRPSYVASTLQEAAAHLELLTGYQACRAFRPHAGLRSIAMLWDFNWFRRRTADNLVPRLADHASAGDIVVIHDGHHEDPRADRHYAVETVDRLIPELRARGLQFGTICP
jgi:peptidoglycan/xylan/chitin deacetylase (PgdA/CDA1 family)